MTENKGGIKLGTSALARSAWLANKRQKLLTPASAIFQRAGMLVADLKERPQQPAAMDLLTDLHKVYGSAQQLEPLIEDLLDPSQIPAVDGDAERKARHELRNGLNSIIGFCEYWLYDAGERLAESLLDGFVPELRKIVEHGRQMLAYLEEMVTFSQATSIVGIDQEPSVVREMICDVVESIGLELENTQREITGGATILVADDNDINRDLLSRLLSRAGHTVTAVPDGKRALELLQNQAFDLLLMDIIMPELDGFQVLLQLKADPNLRHIPVIMISAFDEFDCVVRAIQEGAEDYLPKPFNPVVLRARIEGCLVKKRLLEAIRLEQRRADELLHVILPREIATEMKANQAVKPRRHENVAVLFSDVVGFTPYCAGHEPEQVVEYLNQLTETWEEVALRYQVEKIKTIGDAFMGAAGLLWKTTEDPVLCCVRCGLEMIKATQSQVTGWNLRVGIHFGPVVAGVMGKRQYLFDLWGDTVNTAARMESHGVPGAVILSRAAWDRIAVSCEGESRGEVSVKGRGNMEMIRFYGFRG